MSDSIRTRINRIEEMEEENEDRISELKRKNHRSPIEDNYLKCYKEHAKYLREKHEELRKEEIKMNNGHDPLDDNLKSFVASLYRR